MLAAALLLGAALSGSQAAQPGPEAAPTASERPDSPRARFRPWGRADADLIAAHSPHWLKIYSLLPYKEHWSLAISVRDIKKDLPRVLAAFSKSGGALIQTLESFPSSPSAGTQQLSYTLSAQSAAKVLKALRKVGDFPAPLVRPAVEPVPLAEVKDKIKRLMGERAARAKELAGMPAVSAAVDELLEHLLLVEAVHEKADAEVLLNVTVQEKR